MIDELSKEKYKPTISSVELEQITKKMSLLYVKTNNNEALIEQSLDEYSEEELLVNIEMLDRSISAATSSIETLEARMNNILYRGDEAYHNNKLASVSTFDKIYFKYSTDLQKARKKVNYCSELKELFESKFKKKKLY